MKKYSYGLALLALFFLVALGGSSFAAEAEPYCVFNSTANAHIVDDKAIYDTARSYGFEVYVGFDNQAATEADRSAVGTLTIRNGTYYYYDADENRVDVNGEDKTFDLVYGSGSASYVEFVPAVNGHKIVFRGADGYLQGKSYEWSLLGHTGSGTIQNFRTIRQQLATYAPYIERTASGTFKARIVSPSDTSKAIAAPYAGRWRFSARDKNGDNLFRSDYANFNANETPTMTWTLPASVNPENVEIVDVNIQLREDGPNAPVLRYPWVFRFARRSNEGIAASPILSGPLELDEEMAVTVSFKEPYYIHGSNYDPVLIENESIVEKTVGWQYDEKSRRGTFTIKPLKAGKTTLSVIYERYDEPGYINYATLPVEIVSLSGDSNSEGGGGGGCDAGMGLMGLALAILFSAAGKKRT